MKYKTLLKANLKRHKGSLIGIFILTLLASLALATVLSVWINSQSYVEEEMDRAGFGELTAWVSAVPDTKVLADDIAALGDIKRVETQSLIYSEYSINEQEADNEGQLIKAEPEKNRYKFFTNDLSGYSEQMPEIASGEVYVSPSLISIFGVEIGDKISFPIARQGENVILTIKGYYEDPFMGSSMIGMKGFIIGDEDYNEILQTIQSAGIDALASSGAMLHIFTAETSAVTISELGRILDDNTDLTQYSKFIHSKTAISRFMLVLQNAFSGILLAFVIVLLFVVIIILKASVDGGVEADFVNMGILKTLGFTSNDLRRLQLLQYLIPILFALILGLILVNSLNGFMSTMMLTTTGFLIPKSMPIIDCLLSFGMLIILFASFIAIKTGKIGRITPMKAIRGETEKVLNNTKKLTPIQGEHLYIRLAYRQLITGKRKYISACMIAILLVFFASTVGRMDAWLGADGKGMMDAFNPADHDIGVQAIGDLSLEEMENTILKFTSITDTYLLAMPSVTVNGSPYKANVISEPERFHILQGKTSAKDNEIVLTEFVASDLGVAIGDVVAVSGEGNSDEYIVSGIYQCANDMGGNIGMSRDGYLKIARDDPAIWCYHYFLEDVSQKPAIIGILEEDYGGDVHVHENSWPGLYGIIFAMQALLGFMYVLLAIFILIVSIMTGSKILKNEQMDMAIYKTIGFSSVSLRLTFALRFAMVSAVGSAIGTVLAAFIAEPIISLIMKLCGISNFAANPTLGAILLPAVVVILLFTGFAYLVAAKIKRTAVTVLIAE